MLLRPLKNILRNKAVFQCLSFHISPLEIRNQMYFSEISGPKKLLNLNEDRDLENRFWTVESHQNNFMFSTRNLEILKVHLFKLYLYMSQHLKHLKLERGVMIYHEAEKTRLQNIFMKINNDVFVPILEKKQTIESDKLVLDLAKHIYLFKVNLPLEIYAPLNKLFEEIIDRTFKNLPQTDKRTEEEKNACFQIANICINRMATFRNRDEFREKFLKARSVILEDLNAENLESYLNFNKNLKRLEFDEYFIDLPTKLIDQLIEKKLYNKICMVWVRLNNEIKVDAKLELYVENTIKTMDFSLLDKKSCSLLIFTHFQHRRFLKAEEIDKIVDRFFNDKNSEFEFVDLTMILHSFNKGKALTKKLVDLIVKGLESILFEIGKKNSLSQNHFKNFNYHSCIRILNILSNVCSKDDLYLKLFNDLNLFLSDIPLSGIKLHELFSIFHGNFLILKKLRSNSAYPDKTLKAFFMNTTKNLFRKLNRIETFYIKKENFNNLMVAFCALVQIEDDYNFYLIDSIYNHLNGKLKNYKSLEISELLQLFTNVYELNELDNKTKYEKKYLHNLNCTLDGIIAKLLPKVFEKYGHTLFLISVISKHKNLIKNAQILKETHINYMQCYKNYSLLENTYLIIPLAKCLTFSEQELSNLGNYFVREIESNIDVRTVENIFYNLAISFTEENQLDSKYFLWMEEFFNKNILCGDLKNYVGLSSKIKILCSLGCYEYKMQETLNNFVNLVEGNLLDLKNSYENLNILNVFLIYNLQNEELIVKLLDSIDANLTAESQNSQNLPNYVTLTKLVHFNLKHEYPHINLEKYKNIESMTQITLDPKTLRNKVSYFQKSIKEMLANEKIEFNEEKSIGPFNIDFFINPNICIEINGKSHYINGKKFTKSTERKNRLLKKMGYEIKIISVEEWSSIEDSRARNPFLRQKLMI